MSLSLPALTAAAALALTGGAAGPFGDTPRLHLAGGDAVGSSPTFVPYGYGAAPGGRKDTVETSAAATAQIVAAMQQATRYCGWLQQDGKGEYVIDCLAERIDDVSRGMAGQRGYAQVRAVLDETARELNAVARANRASAQRPIRFRTQDQGGAVTTTNRRLVPVERARQQAAVAQALAVIGEAETRLLRSAEDPSTRGAQFQRIAAAMGSNKVLLRSL